jgi:predicted phage terminase large subunit-like protein
MDLKERMSKSYRELLKSEARNSLSCFIEYLTPDEPPARHHEFFIEKLEAIERREILRATFSCPPGHGKTKICSRYFSAWYLGRHPNHKFLQGGHSQKFAENEFGRYVRDIILEPGFAEIFPETRVNPKSTAVGDWRLLRPARGGYVAKGAGQGISGYRANIGAIDDPFGSREDAQSEAIRKKVAAWLVTDFRTRLLPRSPLFIIATRWHPMDLIGVAEEQLKSSGVPWEIYNLPALIETEEEMALDPLGRSMNEALWPEFYSIDELLELKATLPSGDWQALYKGRPSDQEGNVVKGVWFKRYDRLPVDTVDVDGRGLEKRVRRITVSVDCAEKAGARSNYTVALVWIEDMQGNHYLADVLRKRMEFPEIVKRVEELAAKWNAGAILVEDAGAGVQYIQTRTGKAPAPVIPVAVKGTDKEFRFDGVTPMFEAGEVWLPARAQWLADYETEVLAFPNGTDDDQVDATSQYLSWARKRGRYGTKKMKGTGHTSRTAA